MEIFPETLQKFWNLWEIRGLVLLSLCLQIILITLGSCRKYSRHSWIRILLWCAYLSADSLATISLSVLASKVSNFEFTSSSNQTNLLQTFWAPFLLLHLGGPDSITAYSIEDNELWLRHLLGLVVQIGVAFYVFLRSWNGTALSFIAIPMFIAGVIKYGERTIVLRSSSIEAFEKNLSLNPDTCQDLVIINTEELEDPSKAVLPKDGRTLPPNDWTTSYKIVRYKEAQDAFKMIEVELGFMYDVLYTKATLVYSRLGIFLRCISFFSIVSALVLFTIITVDLQADLWMDICVAFLLLLAAVVMEIYALIIVFFSDWTRLWLIKIKEKQGNPISKTLVKYFWRLSSNGRCLLFLTKNKRWSGCMGQYNLISSCLKKVEPTYTRVHKLPIVKELLERYAYLTWQDVSSDLQIMIFNHLKRKAEELEYCRIFKPALYVESRDKFLTERGNYVLSNSKLSRLFWTTTRVEFDTSLLLWHIATDMCYYHYLNYDCTGDATKLDPKCKISKCLSDYMMYLQMFRSSMIPIYLGEIRYKDTCDAAMEFFKKKKEVSNKLALDGRVTLLEEILEEPRNDDTLSVLHDACELGRSLINFASDDSSEQIWEIISEVWVEMLVYAANNCGWKEHAQQLMKGGELLTHVCLLMTHFGLTKQSVCLLVA